MQSLRGFFDVPDKTDRLPYARSGIENCQSPRSPFPAPGREWNFFPIASSVTPAQMVNHGFVDQNALLRIGLVGLAVIPSRRIFRSRMSSQSRIPLSGRDRIAIHFPETFRPEFGYCRQFENVIHGCHTFHHRIVQQFVLNVLYCWIMGVLLMGNTMMFSFVKPVLAFLNILAA